LVDRRPFEPRVGEHASIALQAYQALNGKRRSGGSAPERREIQSRDPVTVSFAEGGEIPGPVAKVPQALLTAPWG